MLKQKKIYILPILGMMVTILFTTLIFELPVCRNVELSYIDALYEATSLVTATGSNVVDISTDFTFIGQLMWLRKYIKCSDKFLWRNGYEIFKFYY